MKKLLCILLTLAMVVTTMPIMASAAGTYGGLYIFGTEVTANGTVTGNSTIKSGTVDVQYSSDGKSVVVTLNNATIEKSGAYTENYNGIQVCAPITETLEVKLVGTNNINISTTNSGVPVNGIVAQIDSVSTIKITGSGSLNISTTSGWAGGCYDIYNSSGVGANTVEFYDTVKLDLTSPNFCVGSLGKIVFSMDAGGYVHSTSTGAPAIDPYSVISLQHNNTISSPTGGKLGADSKKVLNSDDSDAFEVKIIGGTLTQEPVEYTIIEGAKQEVDLAKASSAVFRSDAEFDDFDSVKVDDVTLTENTDYTAAEGSTIVTLTKSFLNTLKAGTHTLVIVSDDGEAETTFTIKAAPTPTPVVDEDEKVAKTGDNNAIGVFVAMGAISAVAFVSLKKKEQN